MAARLAGLVKTWFPESDYGFIEAEEVEYFCHASRLQNCYALAPSDKVRFTPESLKKRTGKKEASQVYLMQRGTDAKASSVRPAATLESATVLPGKSSENVDNVASRVMRPWCKVSLQLPAEEKPCQPQPGSDDETGHSPANSIAASSSSSVSYSLSVGDEVELLQPPEAPLSGEEGEADGQIFSREAHRANETPSTSAVLSNDTELEELAFAETSAPEAEIEKEKVEVTAQHVEEITAQQVGTQQAGEVAAQQVEEVPVEDTVGKIATQQVEEVTVQQVEEVAKEEEIVEERPQKHFLGYTPPRCWPGRNCEEKTGKKEQETSKRLARQPPMQPAAPAKPVVAGSATGTGPERPMTKSAPEPGPAGQRVDKASSGASEVVRRAGLVTRWHAASNYGFIHDGRFEYFCHASQLKNCVTLASSDQVRFTGVPSEKRPGKKEAREVYLIERGTSTSATRLQQERSS